MFDALSASSAEVIAATAPAPSRAAAAAQPSNEELELIAGLRRREEAAFSRLVARYHNSLLRIARMYVRTQDVAEEVVQETWLGVLKGLQNFEGRCSLKTWVFQILINRAKTRGERESRSIPFSALPDLDAAAEPSVDPDRFLPASHPEWPGHWSQPPQSWGDSPEKILLSSETRQFLQQAIDALPPSQREVITLRDVNQWSSEEVCNALRISETNQRVLLHRARSAVRRALEIYLAPR